MIKYLKFTVLSLALITLSTSIQAQEVKMKAKELWKTLSEVRYQVEQDQFGDLYVPVFNDKAKEVEGELVEVEGFIIPFEGMFKPEQLILSSLPISECFFCGSGGPETVMEITMKKGDKVKYTTKRVKIRGKLVLNARNPNKLMYILVDGENLGLADDAY